MNDLSLLNYWNYLNYTLLSHSNKFQEISLFRQYFLREINFITSLFKFANWTRSKLHIFLIRLSRRDEDVCGRHHPCGRIGAKRKFGYVRRRRSVQKRVDTVMRGWREGKIGDRFGNSEPVRNVVSQFSWPVPPNAADFHLGPSSVSAPVCVPAVGKYTLFHPPGSGRSSSPSSFSPPGPSSRTLHTPRCLLVAPTTTVIIIRSSDRATRSPRSPSGCFPPSFPAPLAVSHDPHPIHGAGPGIGRCVKDYARGFNWWITLSSWFAVALIFDAAPHYAPATVLPLNDPRVSALGYKDTFHLLQIYITYVWEFKKNCE